MVILGIVGIIISHPMRQQSSYYAVRVALNRELQCNPSAGAMQDGPNKCPMLRLVTAMYQPLPTYYSLSCNRCGVTGNITYI